MFYCRNVTGVGQFDEKERNGMRITGVDHVTINVTSMEKSKRFYGQTLQLKEGKFVDMGDHVILYYALDEHNTLELIEYKYQTRQQNGEVDERGMYRHLALGVENVHQAYEAIAKNKDVEILMKPAYCKKLDFTNFLIKDPNGVEIEILERA